MSLTQADLEEIRGLVREVIQEETHNLPTKDEFFTKMDEVMGELKDARDEQTMLAGHSSDHEDRLTKLEEIHPELQRQ